MTAPAWIMDILAVLMLAIAVVSTARLAAASPGRRGAVAVSVDVAHLLMAAAMTGMLAAGFVTLPGAAWQTVFWLLTVWFACQVWRAARAGGWRALTGGHCALHLAHSAAMLYMTAAVTSAAGGREMAGMADMSGPTAKTLAYPTLGFVFTLILVGHAVRDLDRLSGRRVNPAYAAMPVAAMGVPAPTDPGVAPSACDAAQPTADRAAADALPGPAAEGGAEPRSAPGKRLGVSAPLLSPAVTVCCRIAMGVAMAFMLVTMI